MVYAYFGSHLPNMVYAYGPKGSHTPSKSGIDFGPQGAPIHLLLGPIYLPYSFMDPLWGWVARIFTARLYLGRVDGQGLQAFVYDLFADNTELHMDST